MEPNEFPPGAGRMSRRLSRFVLVAGALLALMPTVPAIAGGWNWADEASDKQPPGYAQTQAVCARLRDMRPPQADYPDAAAARALADCDSEALYYGIGMNADPARARQCALLEIDEQEDSLDEAYAGRGLLLTIYANGVGAQRDLDLATALACRIHGGNYEVDQRVRHLQRLKAEDWRGNDYDFCDDASSDQAWAACNAHEARLDDLRSERRIDELSQDWDAGDRAGLQSLQVALSAFVDSSGDNEVDMSGSGRVSFVIEHEQRLRAAFLALLETLESGSLPRASAQEYRAADDRLNATYRQVWAIKVDTDADTRSGREADSLPYGTVTKTGIREAQRAWLEYRDAWRAFAGKHYGGETGTSVATWLTRQRTDALADFIPTPEPGTKTGPEQQADSFKQLSAQDWALLQAASGVTVHAPTIAPQDGIAIQVVFDVNCPYCGELYRALAQTHPHTPIRWVPVAFLKTDSAAIAAAILAADTPETALDCALSQHSTDLTETCGLHIDADAQLPTAQASMAEQVKDAWGGFVPMIVLRTANGQFLRYLGGRSADALAPVLQRAAEQK